jgi:hypothetical protein
MCVLRVVWLLALLLCGSSTGSAVGNDCPWPVPGAGRVYLGAGGPYSLLAVGGAPEVIFNPSNSVPVAGTWLVLPAASYAVVNGTGGVVYTGQVVEGHSYFVSVCEDGATVFWSDANDAAASTGYFWSGFVLAFGSGLLGISGLWVKRLIGSGVNE